VAVNASLRRTGLFVASTASASALTKNVHENFRPVSFRAGKSVAGGLADVGEPGIFDPELDLEIGQRVAVDREEFSP
jgi:hypothetical protein